MNTRYSFILLSPTDFERWNEFYFKSSYPLFNGSISFANIQKLNDRQTSTFICQKDGKDVAGAHYTLKSAFGGFFKTADIIAGIFFKETLDHELLSLFINHFLAWAKKNRAGYVRIAPGFPKAYRDQLTDNRIIMEQVMKENGFRVIGSGPHTYWIDLALTEDQLLERMKPQTRRKLKKAEQSGITAEHYTSYDPVIFDLFWNMYYQLGERKDFNTLSKERFIAEVRALIETGAAIFVLKYQGQVINIALATSYGIASYYHGALNPDYKKLEGCPSPGHFMQWTMIRYMKANGLKIYDMAFCPGPVPLEGHPQFDMWRFKHGFGGDHVQFMPTYGKTLKPLSGKLFHFLRNKR